MSGAPGAKVGGTFTVTPGDTLTIIVGQKGGDSVEAGGGGGGGTFVVKGALDNHATLLLAAGGGGGGGALNAIAAGPGEITQNGGWTGGGGRNGMQGMGGESPENSGPVDGVGGGGSGFFGPGKPYPVPGAAGKAIASGALGGAGQSTGGAGGFGGGGGAGGGSKAVKSTAGGGGGGGGYSGGGGNSGGRGGGGGGSFNATTDASSRIEVRGGGTAGADGSLAITFAVTPPPVGPPDSGYTPGPVPPGSGPQLVPPPPAPERGSGFSPQLWADGAYPIGQPVTFQWPTEGQYIIDRIEWVFEPEDLADLAGAYVQTAAIGQPMPLITRTVQYLPTYPTRAHEYGYIAKLDITWVENGNRQAISMGGTFDVAMPTAALAGSEIFVPKILRSLNDGPVWLKLGDPSRHVKGIVLDFEVSVPGDGAGKASVIQLVKGYRKLTKSDGTVVNAATTGNNWYLDTDLPYSSVQPANNPVASGGTCAFTAWDSPGMVLFPDCNKVEISETFQTHVVYMPDFPAAVWMSLGYVQWSWAATVTRGADGTWPDRVDSSSVTNYRDLELVPSDTPIVWANNVTALRDQIRAVFGALPLDPPDSPAVNAADQRQMLVQCGSQVTSDILSTALAMPIGPWINFPQGFLIWASPTAAAAAASVTGVTSVDEFPVTMRYENAKGSQAALDAATAFTVVVAPFCFFAPDDDSQAFANQNAPLTLDQVSAALVTIAQSYGATATAALDRPDALTLTFATAPGSALLPLLAAHPQVNYVELVQEFRFDDPVNPSR